MVDPMDDIAKQARQGSVSAIIQVLNQKLADSGVRTRAILSDGVLQLLCEAAQPNQLEQTTLVPSIRQTLESLQPRNIRKVTINSRIVREQQLLWLEEINRDPDHQLLWSEQIALKKPNPFRRLVEDWQIGRSEAAKAISPTLSPRFNREKQLFRRGIIGGTGLSLLLLLVGWRMYEWLGDRSQTVTQPRTQPSVTQGAENRSIENTTLTASESVTATIAASPSVTPAPSVDPFVQAVRIAEQAVSDGQVAQSSADWLDLASRWQRASDLMTQISPDDNRYPTAQDRIELYRQNSEAALQEAQKRRSAGASPTAVN
jgi:hypothetical protein